MQRRWWIGIVLVIVVAGLASPVWAQQDPPLRYGQRGPYAVGVLDLVIEDAERSLPVSVWYPALNPNGQPEEFNYEIYGLPFPGVALRDAAPDLSAAPYPLVVFSHGAGGFRQQSVYFTEHLASYGFVVIAADHPGSTLGDLLGPEFDAEDAVGAVNTLHSDIGSLMVNLQSMGGGAGLLAGLGLNYAQRPLDVLRQIDFAETLAAASGPLAGLINTDQVAVAGHSFGGYTTMAAGGARLDTDTLLAWCAAPQGISFDPAAEPVFAPVELALRLTTINCLMYTLRDEIAASRGMQQPPAGLWPATTDPRIRAVIGLAPWNASIFGADGLAKLNIPAMIQVGSADRVTPPEIDAYVFYTGIRSAEKALVVFEGADHFLFANAGMGVDDAVWDMDTAHTITNHYATAFLLAYLYGDADALAVLESGAPDLPGVTVRLDREN